MGSRDNRELKSLKPGDLLDMRGKAEGRVRDDSEISSLGNCSSRGEGVPLSTTGAHSLRSLRGTYVRMEEKGRLFASGGQA